MRPTRGRRGGYERRSPEGEIDDGGKEREREKSRQRRLKFTDECLAGKPGVDQPPLDTHLLRPDALVCDAASVLETPIGGL